MWVIAAITFRDIQPKFLTLSEFCSTSSVVTLCREPEGTNHTFTPEQPPDGAVSSSFSPISHSHSCSSSVTLFLTLFLSLLFLSLQISNQLDLPSYTDRLWEIQACSALKGLGLKQAFMSVNKLIKKSWEVEEEEEGGRKKRRMLRRKRRKQTFKTIKLSLSIFIYTQWNCVKRVRIDR